MIGLVSCISIEYDFLEEDRSPSWSPDGNRLVVECYIDGPSESIAENYLRHYTEEAADICIVDLKGHSRSRITKDTGADKYPIWSPDGSQIAYTRHDGIYAIHPDSSSQRQLMHHSNAFNDIDRVIWSPNGKQLLFSAHLEGSDRDIYLVDVSSGDLINLTQNNNMYDFMPVWTLDGTKVVFLSTTGGHPSQGYPSQLKVINITGEGGERTVYDKDIFVNFVTVSNTNQIIFLGYDPSQDFSGILYRMGFDGKEIIEITPAAYTSHFSRSPDGKYLFYRKSRNFLILEIETGEISTSPLKTPPLDDIPRWSSNGQQIAITTIEDSTGFYTESHIHLLDIQNGDVQPLLP
jgi:Tol biopolymer transport system component